MARDVASDVCTMLEAAGLGLVRPPTAGHNLYASPLPEINTLAGDVPELAVGVVQFGGDAPVPYVGQGKSAVFTGRVQIRIRSPREDFASGQTLALNIYNALELNNSSSQYIDVRCREAIPQYLGPGHADRHNWVINVELRWKDPGAGISAPVTLAGSGDRSVNGNLTVSGWVSTGVAYEDANNVQRLAVPAGGSSTYLDAIAAPGSTSVAHVLDTTATYSTSGGKLLSVRNKGVEKASIDKDGNTSIGQLTVNQGNQTNSPCVQWNNLGPGDTGAIWNWNDGGSLRVGSRVGSYIYNRAANRTMMFWVDNDAYDNSPQAHVFGQGMGSNTARNTVAIQAGGGQTGGDILNLQTLGGTRLAGFNYLGKLGFQSTDSTGSPGNATANTPSGRCAIAAGASSVTITNSLVSASSLVVAVVQTQDGTLTQILRVVPGSGSFTITGNANATGAVNVAWVVIN